jgi:hypothetical protein
MGSYAIRKALKDETNEGWIWLARQSRTVVKNKNPRGKRAVYSQVRDIRDPNFLKHYNQPGGGRRLISDEHHTMVMSQWYRLGLGIPGTATEAELEVKEFGRWGWRWWGELRAASHHPDIVVRLATGLGVLGAYLGILA